jgi:choline dehydrogenase-like flavoprotein
MENKEDWIVLKNATRTCQRLLASVATQINDSQETVYSTSFPRLHYFELLPGPLFSYAYSDSAFNRYAKFFVTTYYHLCGTCRMVDVGTKYTPSSSNIATEKMSSGWDRDGVVDTSFQVLGVKNLRVADASIFPRIPSGPTAATCMAVAEKLADLLKSEYQYN